MVIQSEPRNKKQISSEAAYRLKSYSFTDGSRINGTVALLAWPGAEKRAFNPFTIDSDHRVNCFMDSFF